MQFAPTAQEEAEKINAQTGAGYVTNQEFWEKQGIFTGEDLAISVVNQTYSDLYKELHGFRPRHKSFETVEEAQKAINALDDEYNAMIEMEKMDAKVQAAYEAERVELEDLMPGQFDFEQYPMQSGMGRRMENRIRLSKKQLQKIIAETLAVDPHSHADHQSVELTLEPIVDAFQDADTGEVYGHGGSARMAKSQLFQLIKDAQSIHDRLGEDDELPEWVQSKIAVVADNMSSVADHLDYKMHKEDAGQ